MCKRYRFSGNHSSVEREENSEDKFVGEFQYEYRKVFKVSRTPVLIVELTAGHHETNEEKSHTLN